MSRWMSSHWSFDVPPWPSVLRNVFFWGMLPSLSLPSVLLGPGFEGGDFVLRATLCSMLILNIHDYFGGFMSGFVTHFLVLDGIRKVTLESTVFPVLSVVLGLLLPTCFRVESVEQDPNRVQREQELC